MTIGPTEMKIIRVLSFDIPKTRRQIVLVTQLNEEKVDNALFRLRRAGKILRSKEPLRERERIFKGRGGVSSNLRNYHLYVLCPPQKDQLQIGNVAFIKYKELIHEKVSESKARLLLNFLEENKGQAFYSNQILARLKDQSFKPSDVMTNVRLFEKKSLVYVRGYRTDIGQTPFREGYLITWIDSSRPREKALEEAIEATNRALEDRHSKNPLIERVQKIREQILEATKLKDLVSFDFILNKLSCSQHEGESSVERALQLYSDLKEVKIFSNFRYYYHISFNEQELQAAILMKENYIRKAKGRANRLGHNFEAAVEFFIDSLTTGAKFWSQNHKGKQMDPRRITVYLVKEVAGRRRCAELDRVWEVSPGPLLNSTIFCLECKWGLIKRQYIDDFFNVLRNSKEFGTESPDGRQIRQGVIGVFAGSAFSPKEKVRLKDETEVSLSSYAARMNIQILKTSDINEKLHTRGIPKNITIQGICRASKNEEQVRQILETIWKTPSSSIQVIQQTLNGNTDVFEFEERLSQES